MKFHEEGKDYIESIVFDEETNSTEFYVPKHGNVPFATRYLYDHNLVRNSFSILIGQCNLCVDITFYDVLENSSRTSYE